MSHHLSFSPPALIGYIIEHIERRYVLLSPLSLYFIKFKMLLILLSETHRRFILVFFLFR